jgi:hypothetical protein
MWLINHINTKYKLSSHLRLRLPRGLFPSVFPHHNPVCTSPLLHTCYVPSRSHSAGSCLYLLVFSTTLASTRGIHSQKLLTVLPSTLRDPLSASLLCRRSVLLLLVVSSLSVATACYVIAFSEVIILLSIC